MNILAIFLLVICVGKSSEEKLFGDIDKRDMVTYEFSFLMLPRDEMCFFQYILKNSQLQFSFKVLTASSMTFSNVVNVEIRAPSSRAIVFDNVVEEGDYDMLQITEEGDHQICFFNNVGRFTSKKIQMYIGILNPPHIIDIQKGIEEKKNQTLETYDNMTEQVWNILTTIFHVGHFMSFKRKMEYADLATLEDKLQFINRCSMLMTAVIAVVAFAQTYALKFLFRERLNTPTRKPRA